MLDQQVLDFNLDIINTNPLTYTKNKYLTRFLNSVSITFPVGEKYFLQSVRYYEKMLPEALKEECKIFYMQEGKHSAAHSSLNRLLETKGFPLKETEARVAKTLKRFAKTPRDALIVTVCLELITGKGADLLNNIHHLILKDNSASNLWRYHAIEEASELHRHVADKVLTVVGDATRLEIAKWMFISSLMLVRISLANYRELSKL